MNISCFVFLTVIYLCYGLPDLPDNDICHGKPCSVEQCRNKKAKEGEKCCSKWNYIRSAKKCVPQCINGCKDGECTAPDICTCTLPRVLHNGKECIIPKCEDCSNGKCLGNNNCQCNEGYVMNNKTCKPICDKCENGECVGPNQCKCDPGYKSMKNVENECKPICTYPSVNSICVSPEKYECKPGYEKTELDHICKPICNPACQKGFCVGPNNCTCNQGYEAIEFSWKCEPVCDNCGNGTCGSPNNCTCHSGYQLINNSCKPICNPACQKGFCVGPNNCTCNQGYEAIEFSWKCEPVCDNCGNGTCGSPNNCTCHSGYQLINNSCEPICNPACQKGFCVGPNNCTCNQGYEAIEFSWKCEPVCDNCGNGTCGSPNNCTCHSGYQLINNSCEPVLKSSDCRNDSCLCEGKPCMPPEAEETKMATAGVPWIVGGPILIIIILSIAIIGTIYRLNKRRKDTKKNSSEDIPFGSIVYTKPGTLIIPDPEIEDKIDHLLQKRPDEDEERQETDEGRYIEKYNTNDI